MINELDKLSEILLGFNRSKGFEKDGSEIKIDYPDHNLFKRIKAKNKIKKIADSSDDRDIKAVANAILNLSKEGFDAQYFAYSVFGVTSIINGIAGALVYNYWDSIPYIFDYVVNIGSQELTSHFLFSSWVI